MDFKDIQKIWDTQTNQPLYVINENALHKRIQAKKKQAHHTTNLTELFTIFANACAGGVVLMISIFGRSENISKYAMGSWMLVVALYVLISRIRRIKRDLKFDRTIRGELDHAVSVATYQVNLSNLMRWNLILLGSLLLLSTWEGKKSVWIGTGVLAFLAIVHYFSGWEHNFYKR